MSFSPATGLVYIPAVESSFNYGRERDFKRVPGFWNMGIDLYARVGAKDIPELPQSEYEPGTGTGSSFALPSRTKVKRRPGALYCFVGLPALRAACDL